MKRFALVIFFLGLLLSSKANHITGGQIFYTYLGKDASGNYQYRVTLFLYRDHFSSGAQLDPSAPIAIFEKGNGRMVWSNNITLADTTWLDLVSPDPCILNPPIV